MGYTKYDLDKLNDTENNLKRITENISSIFDEFKEIKNTIDIDIKLRDNIYGQFNTLMKGFENLVERSYNADKVITSAIFEYSSGEQQINTLFNGFVDIANMFHDENQAQTQYDKTSITGISIIQKWFRGLKDYIKSEIDHIKNFLDTKEIRINNKDYSKAKNNSDIKTDYLSTSGNNFDYTSKERIKKIQQFIKNKGINIEVTGRLDRATFQASRMIGIDELKDKGFIQEDSYVSNSNNPLSLNHYTYYVNNSETYIDSSEFKHKISDCAYTYEERKFVIINTNDSSTWLNNGWSLDMDKPHTISNSDGNKYILGEAVKKYKATLKKHEFTNLNIVLYETKDGLGFNKRKSGAFDDKKQGFIEAGTNKVISTIKGMSALDQRHKWDKWGDWGNAGLSVIGDISGVLKLVKGVKLAKDAPDVWKAVRGFANPNKTIIGIESGVDKSSGEWDDGGYLKSWLTGLIPIYGSYSAIVEALSDEPLKGVFISNVVKKEV